jgi:SprT protein
MPGPLIEPSTDNRDPQHLRLQTQAMARTRDLLNQAVSRLGIRARDLEIRFDLRGRAAGQARYGGPGLWIIRYNPVLLHENPQRFIAETVPHEVAHVVAFVRYGHRIRPHGPEWRAIMEQFGATPERCHRYDLSRVPRRATRVFPYHCGCREHELTSIRHHRVLAGQTYLCRRCATPLRPGRRALSQVDPAR